MKNIVLTLFVLISGFSSCTSDNEKICDIETTLSAEQYSNSPSDFLVINSMKIENNCLKINFSASGCDGNSWTIKLIDSGDILKSNPPQRNLKFSLKNDELCLAFVTKEVTFDISNLKVNGNKVQLKITNFDKNILYEY